MMHPIAPGSIHVLAAEIPVVTIPLFFAMAGVGFVWAGACRFWGLLKGTCKSGIVEAVVWGTIGVVAGTAIVAYALGLYFQGR